MKRLRVGVGGEDDGVALGQEQAQVVRGEDVVEAEDEGDRALLVAVDAPARAEQDAAPAGAARLRLVEGQEDALGRQAAQVRIQQPGPVEAARAEDGHGEEGVGHSRKPWKPWKPWKTEQAQKPRSEKRLPGLGGLLTMSPRR
ncbi:MAG: hypothetical protein K2W96_06535 [Gemmataceae bacterium]|nr:hypothetical protein [Gemmataceae bacterium]